MVLAQRSYLSICGGSFGSPLSVESHPSAVDPSDPGSSYSGMWHFYFTTCDLFASTDACASTHARDLEGDVSDNPLRSDLHDLRGRRTCAAA